jgi:hypothetical protein
MKLLSESDVNEVNVGDVLCNIHFKLIWQLLIELG